MSFFLAVELTQLYKRLVDILIRSVFVPQPADSLVACVERGLLAFNTGVFGGNFIKEETLG